MTRLARRLLSVLLLALPVPTSRKARPAARDNTSRPIVSRKNTSREAASSSWLMWDVTSPMGPEDSAMLAAARMGVSSLPVVMGLVIKWRASAVVVAARMVVAGVVAVVVVVVAAVMVVRSCVVCWPPSAVVSARLVSKVLFCTVWERKPLP